MREWKKEIRERREYIPDLPKEFVKELVDEGINVLPFDEFLKRWEHRGKPQ